MQPIIRIDSPLQTFDKFCEVSGLTKRQLEQRIKDGSIPVHKISERVRIVNVAKLAMTLTNGEQATQSKTLKLN